MAQWKYDYMKDLTLCSNCGKSAPLSDEINAPDGEWASPFCPWCGAKMEPDEHNNSLFELNKKEIRGQLDEIKNIVENDVHPAVSPNGWFIYSNLHDELEQLEILLERNDVI